MNYLDMSPVEFDQSENGWRELESQEKYIEAAETILEYIGQNKEKITGMNPSLQVMHFHAGQSYAMAGRDHYESAIGCFKQSYMDSEKWNRYVNGTIAYLSGDGNALHEILQSETMNKEILKAFAESLEHGHSSYRQDYNPPQ